MVDWSSPLPGSAANGAPGHVQHHNALTDALAEIRDRLDDESALPERLTETALNEADVERHVPGQYTAAEGAASLLALKRRQSTLGVLSAPENNPVNPNQTVLPDAVRRFGGWGFSSQPGGYGTRYGADYIPPLGDHALRDTMSYEFDATGLTAVNADMECGPGSYFRWWIDGEYVGDWFGTTTPGGGAQMHNVLTVTGDHRIRLDTTGANLIKFFINDTAVITPTPQRGPKVVICGCSFEGGAGIDAGYGYNALSSWPWNLGPLLGWDDIANDSIGGSGWINGDITYGDRVAGIITAAPDIVIFGPPQNDYNYTPADVAAAAADAVSALRAGLPNVVIIVLGALAPGAPADGTRTTWWAAHEDAIFAAVAPYGAFTIPVTDMGIWTGSGKHGTPGTGNGELMTQSDGVHPTLLGSDRAGAMLAHRIRERLALYFTT